GGQPAVWLSAARLSPDQRWIVFHGARTNSRDKHIWIAPFRRDGTVAPSEVIPFTDGKWADYEPYWYQGRIYFISNRDGFQCIWSRAVDPATGQPKGEPTETLAFHTAQQALGAPDNSGDIGLSLANGFLVFMRADYTGDIWLDNERVGPSK